MSVYIYLNITYLYIQSKKQIQELKDKLRTERRQHSEELEDLRTRLYQSMGERADVVGVGRAIPSKFNSAGRDDYLSDDSDGNFSIISGLEEI